jgi:hypothetical protein
MPTPCSHCRTKNLVCRVDLKSGRCCECVRRAQKCSLRVTKQEFDRLAKMRKQAEEELEKAGGEEEKMASKLQDQQEKLRVQQAKIRRMRKQLRKTERDESEAFDREMASIEEAEQIERELAAQAPVVATDIVSDAPPFEFDDRLSYTTRQWEDFVEGFDWQLVSGGTVAEGSGSS